MPSSRRHSRAMAASSPGAAVNPDARSVSSRVASDVVSPWPGSWSGGTV